MGRQNWPHHKKRSPQLSSTSAKNIKKGRRVLIAVEDSNDSEAICEMLKSEMSGQDFDIDQATDGHTAHIMWQEKRHQLVILGLKLSKYSGLFVTEYIHKEHPLGTEGSAVIIMVTKSRLNRHKEQAESMKIGGYVRKPFQMEYLIAVIERELAKQEQIDNGQSP